MLDDVNFRRISRYATLDSFLRNGLSVLDVNRVTVDDAISMLLNGGFD